MTLATRSHGADAAALVALIAWVLPVAAHNISISTGTLTLEGARIELSLDFPLEDALHAAGGAPQPGLEGFRAALVRRCAAELRASASRHIQIFDATGERIRLQLSDDAPERPERRSDAISAAPRAGGVSVGAATPTRGTEPAHRDHQVAIGAASMRPAHDVFRAVPDDGLVTLDEVRQARLRIDLVGDFTGPTGAISLRQTFFSDAGGHAAQLHLLVRVAATGAAATESNARPGRRETAPAALLVLTNRGNAETVLIDWDVVRDAAVANASAGEARRAPNASAGEARRAPSSRHELGQALTAESCALRPTRVRAVVDADTVCGTLTTTPKALWLRVSIPVVVLDTFGGLAGGEPLLNRAAQERLTVAEQAAAHTAIAAWAPTRFAAQADRVRLPAHVTEVCFVGPAPASGPLCTFATRCEIELLVERGAAAGPLELDWRLFNAAVLSADLTIAQGGRLLRRHVSTLEGCVSIE